MKSSLQRPKFEFNCRVKDKRQIDKMNLDAGVWLPMRFSMSARYNRRAWLNCLPPSLCFHACFARIVPYFDPDRYAMKNVETLIILKRSNEDLVELTSSDVPERSEAWKLSFTRFGEVSELLNDQPSPLTVGCSARGSGLVLEEIWWKMAH